MKLLLHTIRLLHLYLRNLNGWRASTSAPFKLYVCPLLRFRSAPAVQIVQEQLLCAGATSEVAPAQFERPARSYVSHVKVVRRPPSVRLELV